MGADVVMSQKDIESKEAMEGMRMGIQATQGRQKIEAQMAQQSRRGEGNQPTKE